MSKWALASIALTISACANPGPAPLDCNAFLAERQELLRSIDSNRDGAIDHSEWGPVEKQAFAEVAWIDKKYNSTSNPDDIRRIFSEYDVDGDASITFREFTQGLCQP